MNESDRAKVAEKDLETNYVLFVGRPDMEKPHLDMSRCDTFNEKYPDKRLVIFVWEEKDFEELRPKIKSDRTTVVWWKEDGAVRSWLMDNIRDVVGAFILQPRWYSCPDGHITAATYHELVEKCPTCSGGVAIVMPLEDRHKQFAELFRQIASLVTFDTTSGTYLNSNVSPTANCLRNMPYALGCEHETPIQACDLKGTLKGKPALVICAGPSLEDQYDHIKRVQDKCTTIVVGRSFKALRAHGVRVDYAVTVEMFDWDAAIFEGLTKQDVGGTVMAFAAVAAPMAVKKWPGKRVCLFDPSTSRLLGREDFTLGGNSVAHIMYNFAAQILEAEPIVLVGVDLAYTKPKTHADGTTPEGWPEEARVRDKVYQTEKWVRCTGKGTELNPECHRVQTVFGGGAFKPFAMEVKSSPSYESFATLFSILIHKFKKLTLNACPNGQYIDGTEYVDLSVWNP